MRERDDRSNGIRQSDHEDDLDRVLDSALAMYATIKSRPGLEERILANLRAEHSAARRTWWVWALVGALALLIVVLALRSGRAVRPEVAKQRPAPEVAKRVEDRNLGGSTHPIRQVRRKQAAKRQPLPANPKLDQFPSPQPLSEQEQILAMYINQNPESAALIAEARMETLRQQEAEQMRMASEGGGKIGR